MKLARSTLQTSDETARLAPLEELGGRYVRFGTDVLVYADDAEFDGLAARAGQDGLPLDDVGSASNRDNLYLVVQQGRCFELDHPDVTVLFDKGRYLVVEMPPEQANEILARPEHCFTVEPFKDNATIFDVRVPGADRVTPLAWVQNLVNAVSHSSFEADLEKLASFHTRHSTSTHYVQALEWARSQLSAMGYTTTVQPIPVGPGMSQNLIADKQGGGTDTRNIVLVCAHLDSINHSGGPEARAPGADDNASGSAGLLEMARVLKEHPAVHDLRFVLFGGEEEGLFGSRKYVEDLPQAERERIKCVVNMDMIGTVNTPSSLPTVLIEGSELSRSVIDELASAAATYTSLDVQFSLRPFNSDHVPFIDEGISAVLTIEGTDGANRHIHTLNDMPAHVDKELPVRILRMNVAAVAAALEKKGEITVPDDAASLIELLDTAVSTALQRRQLSGRYQYNGGAVTRQATNGAEISAEARFATIADPVFPVEEPIFLDPVDDSGTSLEGRQGEAVGFTLHIDIDGPYPLNVVSGTVAQDLPSSAGGSERAHFIGRATSDIVTGGIRKLVIEDFSFQWPGTDGNDGAIDRLEVELPVSFPVAPSAEVSFIATGSNHRRGPYIVQQEVPYFREVEVEIDREDAAVEAEPYNTLTHPVRPADLPEEVLTLEGAFAKAGIRLTRSSSSNVIDTSSAGTDNKWSNQELHDAMEDHWSAFANRPQWKMWIFLAEHHMNAGYGGVMFDAKISAPGGADRQGTALFTKNAHFHSAGGGFAKANPPEAEAVKRELFFNLVHETGHAFNLLHSFQKTNVTGATEWGAPSWMPIRSNPQALSFMNYGDQATPWPAAPSAKWFYSQFRFRFDDAEHLFLRHAPEEFVQMGGSAWAQNHARVAQADLDGRLGLEMSGIKDVFEFGEPVFVKLTLRNKSDDETVVQTSLNPSEGSYVEVAIQDPEGKRLPFIPVMHLRNQVQLTSLRPEEVISETVNLTVGQLGFPFTKPGMYRIEASYTNSPGGSAAAVTHVYVQHPSGEKALAAKDLFDARVGRALLVDGTRTMGDVNEKMKVVEDKLGEEHPTTFKLRLARGLPFSRPFKQLAADTTSVRLQDPDEDTVDDTLARITANQEVAAEKMGGELYSRAVRGQGNFLAISGRRDEAVQLATRTRDFFQEMARVGRISDDVLVDMESFVDTLEERA